MMFAYNISDDTFGNDYDDGFDAGPPRGGGGSRGNCPGARKNEALSFSLNVVLI